MIHFVILLLSAVFFFFFDDTATTEIYTLSYTTLFRSRRNPVAEREGVAGYELALNYNGVPFQLIPRASSEIKKSDRFQLRSEEHTSELQSRLHLVCRLLLEKKKK